MQLPLYLKYGPGGPTIWVAAAECEDAGRFIVRADKRLTAFLQLESGIPFAAVNTVYWQRITMSNLFRTTER
jgi:hypothetical protein